jgi:hypothetical protein
LPLLHLDLLPLFFPIWIDFASTFHWTRCFTTYIVCLPIQIQFVYLL